MSTETAAIRPHEGPYALTLGDVERQQMSIIHKADDPDFRIGYVLRDHLNVACRAEDDATARLLTASWKLLAAARHVLPFIQYLATSGSQKNGCQAACDELEAAIQEATVSAPPKGGAQ